MKAILVWVIKAYRLLLSPWLGGACRFYPTCSCYMATSLERFGFLKGLWLGLKRLGRCHPWGGSGVDEVPEK